MQNRIFRGRHRERQLLDERLDGARAGRSQVLVVRGEMGIGKTALLDDLCGRAAGFRVVRAPGAGSEIELDFAGLHRLFAPFLDRLSRLPGPQADALEVVFGLRGGDAPDRLLVGLAALTLLSDIAEEGPLLCVLDDAQWLDRPSAQALAFAARRLMADPVVLLFGVREPCEDVELASFPALSLSGLAIDDARAVLDSILPGPLDPRVRDRIVAETRGNPLALHELPRALTPEELTGGFGFSETPMIYGRIEDGYLRRLETLPETTRRLLLVAAAEPLGDPVLVLRAADALGIAATAAAPAAHAGLVELGGQVRFSHPLIRRVVYTSATPGERRAVHRALADATDAGRDPDRRAWHRGQATAGLDEAVAAELEHSAARARSRGGFAAGGAFLQRAAELTPEPGRRSRRALAAAEANHRAGAGDAAMRLLSVAETGPLDETAEAQAELVRAQIAFSTTRGRDAPALLLSAAKRLEPINAPQARETYRDALLAALSAGVFAEPGSLHRAAEGVLSATPDGSPGGRLLEGFARLTRDGHGAAAAPLQDALESFDAEPLSDDGRLRWMWLACTTARAVADDARWDAFSAHQLRLARRTGALSLLPVALAERFNFELLSGDLEAAASLAAESDAVIDATGAPPSLTRHTLVAAWRGREEEAIRMIDATRRDVVRRGEGQWLIATEWLTALLFNGLGRYEDALAAAVRASGHPLDVGLSTWVLTERVEAAARSGRPELAVEPARRLTEIARASGTDWALGLAARSNALLLDGAAAELAYQDAIARLARTRIRSALARAQLVYGEWLRRERQRVDAREQLRAAHEAFTTMGADAFADRARRELLATGEIVRRRSPETLDDLTPQETEIARMAAGGKTNAEIGSQLFLSPRTVEWHLRKVFGKLGVSSRRDLPDVLAIGAR